ncbi:hypothetical protein BC939DRAFT_280274 [Gamsiella multidivaricata]|uniref:uncharacterized protein n=1 Tax=Gamsiella multidivaricata TaxID=101098 RepID=UPI00221E5FBF|nr:uncharacterized protein BC939DRAFT_280274 [Gamsiella multidivaricata]KAI7830376.1 hypothetical protein BC939DRAFT_280274 [Gamsiella multidivaricata]
MAVKAKKRRLSIAARRDHEGKNQQTKVEAELERQEEEMLAVARLLKQVDKAEAVTVAKQILTATTIASKMDEDAQSSGMNGSSMMVLNGSATKANGAADRTRSKSAHSRNGVQERETVAMVTPPSDREIRTVDLGKSAMPAHMLSTQLLHHRNRLANVTSET